MTARHRGRGLNWRRTRSGVDGPAGSGWVGIMVCARPAPGGPPGLTAAVSPRSGRIHAGPRPRHGLWCLPRNRWLRRGRLSRSSRRLRQGARAVRRLLSCNWRAGGSHPGCGSSALRELVACLVITRREITAAVSHTQCRGRLRRLLVPGRSGRANEHYEEGIAIYEG